jgi:Helix-hairpin-helix motif
MCTVEESPSQPDAPGTRRSQPGGMLPWSWTESSRLLLAVLAIGAATALLTQERGGRTRNVRSPESAVSELRIDPSSATPEALATLPAIGPTLARRIVDAQADGPFRSPADLRARVRGIGPVTLARIEPYLRFEVGPGAAPGAAASTTLVADAGSTADEPSLVKSSRSRTRKAKGSSVRLVAKGAAPASP